MTLNTHTLFPADELENNESKAVSVNHKNILICKHNGNFYAVDNQCTHRGTELTDGRIRHCVLSCPSHGARFDLRTGESIGGLTKTPLKTYAVAIVDSGLLQLHID